jgi:myo-inositol-1(or 4)-monophosphatase
MHSARQNFNQRVEIMEPELNQLIDWARHAGGILREGYGKRHQINHKGRIDLTTEADHASEAYLLEQIRAHFPGHTIETEESGLLSGADEKCWYVDPLDGTTNYAHSVPAFCVSLAYAVGGKMKLGVVYEPMRDETFSAAHGEGAWLNGKPVHVSETEEMVHSLLATGFPYDRYSDTRSNLAAFEYFTRASQGVRRFGAAAIDLCYVAAGRYEGYWEQTLHSWDIAAGALIVEEAGGVVTRLRGEADYLRPPCQVLAGNPAIHALLMQAFQHNPNI